MSSLVVLHGLIGHLNFAELRNAFAQTDVYTPDLIGYGEYRHENTANLTLADQADHVIANIQQRYQQPVHLLGHSVGGAVAALVANKRPDLLQSLISVEGNFTLKDAFWSAQIAKKPDAEVSQMLDSYRADANGWMNGAIAAQTDLSSRLAVEWLANQPAATIKAQASAVVAATTPESYLENLQQTMKSKLPVHLISGALSASGWDTPAWANQLCSLRINVADTGHLMMVESPQEFANAVTTVMHHC